MTTKPVGSDHNEDADRRPKVLPSVTVNRGLLPDSWGILGRLRKRKAEDRRSASDYQMSRPHRGATMSNETKADRTMASDEIRSIAADFENREVTPDELTKIKRTRRRSPRIGEARAEVYTFRAPPSYKNRIKQRAASDDKTESQVIRDALDAYL